MNKPDQTELWDYAICGAGAAGLMLAYRMAVDPYFSNCKILILDKNTKTTNDRTWCFWEKGEGEWDHLLFRSWDQALFKYVGWEHQFQFKPYRYKMLRGLDFYKYVKKRLEQVPNIHWLHTSIERIEDLGTHVAIYTQEKRVIYSSKVFNSLFNVEILKQQTRYPYLKQHFLGWAIRTPKAFFDPACPTFMDFSIPQNGNTRFMYVLPFNEKEALIEYTLFSEELLSIEEYEQALKEHLHSKGLEAYDIIDTETGNIPMTAFPFHIHNTSNMLHIGSSGGWTRASTGFTFKNCTVKTRKLVNFLKKNRDLTGFHQFDRHRWYDMLLLDILHEDNSRGGVIFTHLFKKNQASEILAFLQGEMSLYGELRLMFSLPVLPFLKALARRCIKTFAP